jgi:hypothetical protein
MPSTYERTPLPHHLHVAGERCSMIELDGLPQVPDAINTFWQYHGFDVDPPEAIRKKSDEAIADFMALHQERRLAKLRASTKYSHSRFRLDEDEADEDVSYDQKELD